MIKYLLIGILSAMCAFAQDTNKVVEVDLTGDVISSTGVLKPISHGSILPNKVIFLEDDGEPMMHLTLTTNVSTVWVPIEKMEGERADKFKQVGFLTTNRVLVVEHDGQTNEVFIKLLGREEWPSTQRRVVALPKPAK